MFESILASFGAEKGIHRLSMVANITSNVVKAVQEEFKEDKSGKNAAIDALIDLLQKHKDPV